MIIKAAGGIGEEKLQQAGWFLATLRQAAGRVGTCREQTGPCSQLPLREKRQLISVLVSYGSNNAEGLNQTLGAVSNPPRLWDRPAAYRAICWPT